VAGKIVITFRALCARNGRAINGQAAGAAAVVMITNSDGFPPFEGTISGVTIPFLGALIADTDRIVATDGETVTIEESGGLPNPTYLNFAGFSSGGPASGDSSAKPDIIAPGVSIVSAFFGTGVQGVTSSGTSLASPHVAGLAGLVRQAHPSWSAEAVKAAIVNTADPSLMIDYLTTRAGAGVAVPADAVATNVLAFGDPYTSSLSLGFDESTGVMEATKTATLTTWARARPATTCRSNGTPMQAAPHRLPPRRTHYACDRTAGPRST
jgi:subtilisin family serine protease